ncbi:ACY3 [Symbiodinium sp. CCMP2456]|nr:ACY3 [Symbiodinium sp. CCMP2456]
MRVSQESGLHLPLVLHEGLSAAARSLAQSQRVREREGKLKPDRLRLRTSEDQAADILAREAVGFWAARQSQDLSWSGAALCGIGAALDYTVNRGFVVALLIGYEGLSAEASHGLAERREELAGLRKRQERECGLWMLLLPMRCSIGSERTAYSCVGGVKFLSLNEQYIGSTVDDVLSAGFEQDVVYTQEELDEEEEIMEKRELRALKAEMQVTNVTNANAAVDLRETSAKHWWYCYCGNKGTKKGLVFPLFTLASAKMHEDPTSSFLCDMFSVDDCRSPLVVHDACFGNRMLLIMDALSAKMLTAILAFLMAGAQARLGETSERLRNASRPSPEDLLPGGAARREEYWSNSTLRFNVNPSLSKLHDVTRRLGYDHLATTTRYGDTCCASCGSIDTAKLVAGTGFYAVASAEAMQAHGIGDGHYCTKDASGSSGMGCLSCARGKFLWYHPFDYPLWAQKGSSIFRKELNIVVADTCPHAGNEAWCPGRQGSTNKFGVRHHFDFASPPGKYDNYYFAWKKMECPDYIKRRYASLSRC